MVKSVLGETDTYRIQNLVSGTYMDLAGSKLKAPYRTFIILQVSPSRFGFERHADHWIPQDEPGGEPEMDNQERNDRNWFLEVCASLPPHSLHTLSPKFQDPEQGDAE